MITLIISFILISIMTTTATIALSSNKKEKQSTLNRYILIEREKELIINKYTSIIEIILSIIFIFILIKTDFLTKLLISLLSSTVILICNKKLVDTYNSFINNYPLTLIETTLFLIFSMNPEILQNSTIDFGLMKIFITTMGMAIVMNSFFAYILEEYPDMFYDLICLVPMINIFSIITLNINITKINALIISAVIILVFFIIMKIIDYQKRKSE